MFEGRGCLLCALPLLASSPGQSILEFTEIAHVAVQDLAGLHPIHVGSSGWIVFFLVELDPVRIVVVRPSLLEFNAKCHTGHPRAKMTLGRIGSGAMAMGAKLS